MANKALFSSLRGQPLPKTDTRNEAGGVAYRLTPQQALAQYAVTGCLNGTFYADAQTQLGTLLKLCDEVAPEFIARTALYAREQGQMKDMPALLAAVLSIRDGALLERIFPRVMDNARMVRNFVQVMRSGAVGRKSLGSRPKRLLQRWLTEVDARRIIQGMVGQSPSLADVVKMVHPRPETAEREALLGYLIGRPVDAAQLPEEIRALEAFKAGDRAVQAQVPFQLLTAQPLGRAEWTDIARHGSWQMTRMNLNSFTRHGVFDEPGMAHLIAQRLADAQLVRKARALPYQLLAAWTNVGKEVPSIVREALHAALEAALDNVPRFAGKVYLLVDVSGSMSSPATGYRRGASSTVRCIDVAALFAAAVVRKNPGAEVLPFDTHVHRVRLSPRNTVLTNAEKLARFGGGGTHCALPLQELNRHKAKGDLVIYLSDNESWIEGNRRGATDTMAAWEAFRARNRQAKLVCIDIQPYATSQAQERAEILNIGGFSDAVFEVVGRFAEPGSSHSSWVERIEAITL